MEPGCSQEETGPSRLIERWVCRAIPPAAREAVVGDLAERYRSRRQYLFEATRLLPHLVASQVRRNCGLSLVGVQFFVLFACLGGFERLADYPYPWVVALPPTLFAVTALILRDVYGERPHGGGRAGLDVLAVILGVALAESLLALLPGAHWLLPRPIATLGLFALPVLCVLRNAASVDVVPRALTVGPAASIQELAQSYRGFRSDTVASNRIEIVILLVMIVGGALFRAAFDAPLARVAWLTYGALSAVALYLALRGEARALRAGSDFQQLRTLYQTELLRQHKLRRWLTWFWLLPLFAGLLLKWVGYGLRAERPQLVCLGIAFVALLILAIAGLARQRGRRVQKSVLAIGLLQER